MKCLSLISMISRYYKRIALLIMISGFLLILFGCSKNEYPRPTNQYYINDYADILYQATRSSITREGERLYEVTQDEVDGGAQLVVATFVVENITEVASYDKTEIFRQWEIGKNDMGLLVLLFFTEETIDDIDYLTLVETQIEVGYRMEQYLTPTQLGQIVDNTLLSGQWDDDLDMGVMHMVYELLSAIYIDAYGYESFNYDMDVYEEYLINNPDIADDDSHIPLTWLLYLLSPFATAADRWGAILPIIIFALLGGGGIFIKNKGGGGSSGGMGIFRRRR
ncbi:MAG: TPM domain-containing protein [Acholeplasmataceae bacterium]|nr:TPM domain-containing protein [Acholeplasmataceae bacterium]